MGSSHGPARVDPGQVTGRPAAFTAVAWAVTAGVVGFVLSVVLGIAATAVTFSLNPDEGASFIGIWFWMLGPPVSALVMAAAARWRCWDRSRVWQSAAVTFAVCLGCGIFAMSTLRRPTAPPPDPSPFHPPVTPLHIGRPGDGAMG